jgi:hypothetical protein
MCLSIPSAVSIRTHGCYALVGQGGGEIPVTEMVGTFALSVGAAVSSPTRPRPRGTPAAYRAVWAVESIDRSIDGAASGADARREPNRKGSG